AGTTLSVTASNSAGTSAATTVTVKERLAAPTINDYYTTEAFARGMAPGASKVAIYVNGQLVRTAAVDPNGSYSIYTGDIESLRTAGNTFEIAAIDAAGTESEKTQQTVQLKLEAPTVNTYFTSAQAVTGKATGLKVNLYVNGTLVGEAPVAADGTYSIDTSSIAAMKIAGTQFQISTLDSAGNEGPKTTMTVIERLAAPTINDYHPTEAFARGTATGASRVGIYVAGKLVRTAAVDPNGSYSIYTGDIASLQKIGNTFKIVAIDAAGYESETTEGTVIELITADVYRFGIDKFVTGQIGLTTTKVKIVVDGVELRQTVTNNGTYEIYAEDLIKDASQNVEIVGYDSNNRETTRVVVQVK
uniref:Ig-like domain-containing protein n=1 Tax=Bacillus cereus group sp. BfR-BA-01354 TaxID=2920317 RepID=UPI001F590846